MANFCQGGGLFWVAFFATVTGVMAERLDTDLIGVVVAAVCIGILSIVIIAFMAYCCFRRIEYDRKSVLMRKDSESVSNGVGPRWAPNLVPSNRPVYSVPAEPVMYAVPANYYLGHYAPKFIDAEQLQYMRPYPYGYEGRREGEEEEEEHSRRAQEYQEHVRQREEQYRVHEEQQRQAHHQQTDVTTTTVTQEGTEASQPDGQAGGDFFASSINYKVIRKQHKHEKMPEWLRKDYDENEKSMDVGDDVSRASSTGSTRQRATQATPLQAVRAQVSPKNSVLDSDDVLHVSRDFTIVDYVDHDQRRPLSASSVSYRVEDNSQGYRITTHTTTTTAASSSSSNAYHAQRAAAADTSHASVSTYVPPASTSTPRAPPEIMEDIDDLHRMRRPGQGSVTDLPDAERQAADVQF